MSLDLMDALFLRHIIKDKQIHARIHLHMIYRELNLTSYSTVTPSYPSLTNKGKTKKKKVEKREKESEVMSVFYISLF